MSLMKIIWIMKRIGAETADQMWPLQLITCLRRLFGVSIADIVVPINEPLLSRYQAATNGSRRDIAGIVSDNRRVLGMMPHPERAADAGHGGTDGSAMFAGLIDAVAEA